jgi:O-succinylbenzoic acid--CoA ligase
MAVESHTGIDRLPAAPASVLCDDIDGATVHSVIFTSGTTGRPKGVMLTHANHEASARASARRLGTTRDDVWLLCLPLFYVGGLAIVLRSVVTGFAVVLHERFDAAMVNRTIIEEGVTAISVVPTMLFRLLGDLDGRGAPPSPRCVLIGGGPLPARLAERARAAGLPLAPTYGLTEASSQVATARPRVCLGAPAHGAVGPPLPDTEIRIDRPDRNGVGQILVRGPTVMRGYFGDAAATAGALRDGWLYTGDYGQLQEGNTLAIAGRRTDLIVTGGEKVYPADVEEVLEAHPAVAEAAVYGVPDDEWGQRVIANIVPADAAPDTTALRTWCRARLAAFKVPVAFEVVPALPRTATGKLDRRRL